MIVKVQLSLSTTKAVQHALIYDETRDVRWSGDASQDLIGLMDGRHKAFLEASILEDGTISIDEEADWQEW